MARLPTYGIPLGMSYKNNKPCHGLILVLIVVFFQCFVSYLFGRTVLQSRNMMRSDLPMISLLECRTRTISLVTA